MVYLLPNLISAQWEVACQYKWALLRAVLADFRILLTPLDFVGALLARGEAARHAVDGVIICTPENAAIFRIGGELLVVGAPEATFKMQYIKLNQTYDLLGYPGISSQQAHRAANLPL